MSEQSRPDTSWRRILLFGLLFVGLTAAGLYVVYSRVAERNFSVDPALFSPGLIAGCIALLVIYFSADGLRLHFTLRALGHRISLRALCRLVFINIFFSNVTPMATGGGFAQVWYLRHHGVPVGVATAATTIRTVLAVIFIFSLTPVFLLTLSPLEKLSIGNSIGIALAVLIVLYLSFFAVVLFRTRWLIPPLSRLVAGLHRVHLISEGRERHWQFKVKREMLRFARSFGVYLRGDKRFVTLSVLFTFIFLLSLFSFPALLMVGLGYDVDYLLSLGCWWSPRSSYFSPTPRGIGYIGRGIRFVLPGHSDRQPSDSGDCGLAFPDHIHRHAHRSGADAKRVGWQGGRPE